MGRKEGREGREGERGRKRGRLGRSGKRGRGTGAGEAADAVAQGSHPPPSKRGRVRQPRRKMILHGKERQERRVERDGGGEGRGRRTGVGEGEG